MSAVDAIEAAEFEPGEFDEPARAPGTHLRLVPVQHPVAGPHGAGLDLAGRVISPGRRQPVGVATGQPASAPLRLTRRGRMVASVLAVVLATLAITVISMVAAGAQAANHGRAGAGYLGMPQIVVRPGQTLWSIAARAEPAVDPRDVVAQIMTANSMTSSVLQAGRLLWVPK